MLPVREVFRDERAARTAEIVDAVGHVLPDITHLARDGCADGRLGTLQRPTADYLVHRPPGVWCDVALNPY